MTHHIDLSDYKPGDYRKKRVKPSDWLNAQFQKWCSAQEEHKRQKIAKIMVPTVCISRKIGVGALEVADHLSNMIDYKVVDRQILEHMAADGQLSEKTVNIFDERYPGKMKEFSALLFAEKSFIKSDYARQLAKSVIALANLEPTIFVGRGTHLVLPRENVMAVRLIGSPAYRIKRLAGIMEVSEAEAEKRMAIIDKEQREFFKTMYNKKDAVPYEFDLVINMDYIPEPKKVANIIACAFDEKFEDRKV
ncbi:MAG: cytidylate kinase-like family protein [Proteobacteria bacterium]|nr:cytidylate kinase-like family protein [Pseudomonadota bacterium]